jgi:hypothetical protein
MASISDRMDYTYSTPPSTPPSSPQKRRCAEVARATFDSPPVAPRKQRRIDQDNPYLQVAKQAQKGTLTIFNKEVDVIPWNRQGSSVDLYEIKSQPGWIVKVLKDSFWTQGDKFFKESKNTYEFLKKNGLNPAETLFDSRVIIQKKCAPFDSSKLEEYSKVLDFCVQHADKGIAFDPKISNFGIGEKGELLWFDWSELCDEDETEIYLRMNLKQALNACPELKPSELVQNFLK